VTIVRPLALAAAAGALALAACTGGGSRGTTPSPDAATMLREARATLDAAPAVHFTLASADVPTVPAALLGGEGDVARPDRFSGALDVRVAGAQLRVKVVSVGGSVWAQFLSSSYTKVDPERFGLTDPGTFMSPETGLTQLVGAATGATLGAKTRAGADVVQEIRATVPGEAVSRVLRTADPSKPVPAVFGVVEGSKQLRRATLTGPFFQAGTASTYTLVLDRYGQQVDIRAPAGG
jgi:lipoprotein LprG